MSGVPEGWTLRLLKDIVDPARKVTYGIVQPGEFVKDGVLLVKAGDYSTGWVPIEKMSRVSPQIDEAYRRSRIKSGDILLTIVGSLGNVALVPQWLGGANLTQQTARIAINESCYNRDFFFFWMQSNEARKQVYKHRKDGVQPALNLADVEKFACICPPLEEQRKIAGLLNTWDEAIEQQTRLLELKRERKRGLMQQLLTGKVRFKEFEGLEWKRTQIKRLIKESRIPGSTGKEAQKITVKLYGKGVYAKEEKRLGSESTKYFTRKAGQFIYSKLDFLNGAFGVVPRNLDGYESTLDLPWGYADLVDTCTLDVA